MFDALREEPSKRIGTTIRALRASAGMSVRELARSAGINNGYLSQLESGARKPSAATLRLIADSLRVPPRALYQAAGFLEEESTSGAVERAIARDPSLTGAQKAALVEAYRAFAGKRG